MKVFTLLSILLALILITGCNEKPDSEGKTQSEETESVDKIVYPEFGDTNAIGAITTTSIADSLFGVVLDSESILTSELTALAADSREYMLFHFKSNMIIANESRSPLYPAEAKVSSVDTFVVYNTSKVLELLDVGKSATTYIQKRANKVTITNGTKTLEWGAWCPPYCAPEK